MKDKRWWLVIAMIAILVIAFLWTGESSHTKSNSTSLKPTESISTPSEQAAPVAAVQGQDQAQQPEDELKLNSAATDTNTVTEPDTRADVPSEAPADADHRAERDSTKSKNPEEQAQPAGEVQSESGNKTVPEAVPAQKPSASGDADASKDPDTKPKKDKYQTDPVPEGKPKPVEWQEVEVDKDSSFTITMSVTAATILDNLDQFDPDKLEILPKDGIIYTEQEVNIYEGESVFDVLLREMKRNKIHMEFEMTPLYNSNYIEGIQNIYEFDCGELSGWMYKVNGWFPNYGSSRYKLKDGDVVEWVYTCDLGRDIGGDTSNTGETP